MSIQQGMKNNCTPTWQGYFEIVKVWNPVWTTLKTEEVKEKLI